VIQIVSTIALGSSAVTINPSLSSHLDDDADNKRRQQNKEINVINGPADATGETSV
jgi:hypothetical protein